jgi:hypothetical protein
VVTLIGFPLRRRPLTTAVRALQHGRPGRLLSNARRAAPARAWPE